MHSISWKPGLPRSCSYLLSTFSNLPKLVSPGPWTSQTNSFPHLVLLLKIPFFINFVYLNFVSQPSWNYLFINLFHFSSPPEYVLSPNSLYPVPKFVVIFVSITIDKILWDEKSSQMCLLPEPSWMLRKHVICYLQAIYSTLWWISDDLLTPALVFFAFCLDKTAGPQHHLPTGPSSSVGWACPFPDANGFFLSLLVGVGESYLLNNRRAKITNNIKYIFINCGLFIVGKRVRTGSYDCETWGKLVGDKR